MKIIFSVLDRYDLWPHFRSYYQAQGITQFVCVSYGPRLPGTIHIDANLPPSEFTGSEDALRHNKVIQDIIKPDEWFFIADLDEFIQMEGTTLVNGIQVAQEAGANCIQGIFNDRITPDGSFPAKLEDDIWKQFPIRANVTEKICGGLQIKLVALRGPTPVNSGHHTVREDVDKSSMLRLNVFAKVHHFKWWGENVGDFFWNRTDEPGLYRVELSKLTEHFKKHNGIDLTVLDYFE